MLPSGWLYDVLAEKAPSSTLWINPLHTADLEKLQLELDDYTGGTSSGKLDLGLRAFIPSKSCYFSEEEWKKEISSSFVFKSDRFFNPYSPDLGSSRNLIFKDGCWKGVGRNQAATRLDYRHASGIMSHLDVVIEVIFSEVLSKYAPLLNVPVYGAFTFDDQPSSYIIRSSDSIRCSQIPGILEEEDRLLFISYITNKLGVPVSECMLKIMNNLATLLKTGVFHLSPTPDNITIDGRLLDHQSIEWIEGIKTSPIFCQVFLKSPQFKVNEHTKWQEVFNQEITDIGTPINFLSSKYHSLRKAFNILRIPSASWGNLTSHLSIITGLPEVFFKFGKENSKDKISWFKEHLDNAERDGQRIYIYQKDASICLSVGHSIQSELPNILSKLLQVSLKGETSADYQLLNQRLSEVLNSVLKRYLL